MMPAGLLLPLVAQLLARLPDQLFGGILVGIVPSGTPPASSLLILPIVQPVPDRNVHVAGRQPRKLTLAAAAALALAGNANLRLRHNLRRHVLEKVNLLLRRRFRRGHRRHQLLPVALDVLLHGGRRVVPRVPVLFHDILVPGGIPDHVDRAEGVSGTVSDG
uniref:(northern house mosquito) hypothetical protein n=1 Tax=Culex pipiens TaxID=7175 RepID=A0A8D8CXC9_CULPI